MAGGAFNAIDYAEALGLGVVSPVTDRVSQPYIGGNKIRNRAISNDLLNILTAVGNERDVYFVVESGGQTSSRSSKLKGVKGGWTGSHRHDDGGAGDVMAYRVIDGQKHFLDFTDSDDRAEWGEIVRLAVSLGAEGVGAGEHYMGTKTVHIGFGGSATWGSVDGSYASPDWLVDAHSAGLRTPPMSIPDVASAVDLGAPLPLPNAVRYGALAEVEKMRSTDVARRKLYESSAMYGVRAPGSPLPDVPAAQWDSTDLSSSVPWVGAGRYDPAAGVWVAPTWGEALGSMMSVPATFDDIGPGPSSWFGAPDVSATGLGGVVLGGSSMIASEAPPAPAPPAPPAGTPPAPQKEFATLPSGKLIEVGTHRNSQGDLVTVSKGPDGKAVINKVEVPWYLKEGDGTLVGGAVKDKIVETANEEAKKAIDSATIFVSDTAAGLAPKMGGVIDAAKQGAGQFLSDLWNRSTGTVIKQPASPAPNPNSVDKLEEFTSWVYAGILPITPGDDLEDGAGPDAIKLRPPSVIPADIAGRWLISPARISETAEIKAPRLTTAIAFDPTFTVKQTFSTPSNAGMAMAFDRFTLPATAATSAPAVEWQLLDGPAWNEAMKRREDWVRSSTTPRTPAPVTEGETRAEQAAMRRPIKSETSTSTVTTPTKPGITGDLPVTTKPTAPMPAPPITRVPTQPSTKPTTKMIQVTNPDYIAWEKRYGGGAPAPTGADSVGKGPGTFGDLQQMAGKPAPAAPIVPPAPPRYVDKRVSVPSTSSQSRDQQSSMSGGLYVVGPGDTLSAISKRTGVSVAELQRLNGIGDPDRIYAGAKLRISQNGNAIAPAPRIPIDTATATKRGAERGAVTQAASSSDVRTFKGSATDRTYVVGKIYVNSQGVRKMATADGKFVEV